MQYVRTWAKVAGWRSQGREKYLRLLGRVPGAHALEEKAPQERPDWEPATTHLAMPVRPPPSDPVI